MDSTTQTVHPTHEPLPLPLYTRAVAEYSLERDRTGRGVETEIVLARYGFTVISWADVTNYWAPRVNDPSDPACRDFRVLLQQESDRLLGVSAEGQAPVGQKVLSSGSDGGRLATLTLVRGFVKGLLG